MEIVIQQTRLRHLAVHLGIVAALVLAGHARVQAQTIYRLVSPDGKVTFSDTPPAASGTATITDAGGQPAGSGRAVLPYELRQVVGKYPVTLYTASNCVPCGAGRALLGSRGIPYTEKTVNTAEDSAALQRISGGNSLPFLTIGGQQIKGYSDSEWTQFLNAAGYPKSPQLPPGYRNPTAVPLVTVQKTAPATKPEQAVAPVASPEQQPSPAEAPPNPAGIKF